MRGWGRTNSLATSAAANSFVARILSANSSPQTFEEALSVRALSTGRHLLRSLSAPRPELKSREPAKTMVIPNLPGPVPPTPRPTLTPWRRMNKRPARSGPGAGKRISLAFSVGPLHWILHLQYLGRQLLRGPCPAPLPLVSILSCLNWEPRFDLTVRFGSTWFAPVPGRRD